MITANNCLIGQDMFNPKDFVEKTLHEIRATVKEEKVLAACSGGVDSVTATVLMHKAIQGNLVIVFIDTGFMRLNEPEEVELLLRELRLPIKIVDAKKRFLEALKGLEDAEEKRKKFREIFYGILGENARAEGCNFLVQGTIAPDWIETRGGIKTQHNILSQIGIDPVERFGFQVLEPLAYLYKDQVRTVAKHLGIPSVPEKQPFPGPGLLVRAIGRISEEKIDTLKAATKLVEENIEGDQCFVAIADDNDEKDGSKIKDLTSKFFGITPEHVKVRVPKCLVTGVKGDLRAYKKLAALTIISDSGLLKPTIERLVQLQVEIISKNPDFTRVVYNLTEKPRKGKYLLFLRSVRTRDYMTADVSSIEWDTLTRIAEKLMEDCKAVSAVYYDITPKPPATVEYE